MRLREQSKTTRQGDAPRHHGCHASASRTRSMVRTYGYSTAVFGRRGSSTRRRSSDGSAGVSSELAHPATTPTGASQPGVGGARGGPAGRVHQCRAAAVRGAAFFYMSSTERWQSCDQCASSSVAKQAFALPIRACAAAARGGQHGFFRHSAAIKNACTEPVR